jgi:hypothetical protein
MAYGYGNDHLAPGEQWEIMERWKAWELEYSR